MVRDLKYLFAGLSIGAVIFVLLMGAVVLITPGSLSPDIRPAFLNTPTFTPAPPTETQVAPALTITDPLDPPTMLEASPTLVPSTPAATETPIATPTQSPGEIALQTGQLVVTGPRTEQELVHLYETSLAFVAPTFSQARKLGEQINGKGYGSPTLICGPLSIAILRAAGFVPPNTLPYSFWQLNPDDGEARLLLKSVFPPNQYTDTRIKTRIDEVDWKKNPLEPGDFLYIYAGNGGNFEHMLVVNRVDAGGRAYSVTNFNPGDGFIIQEVMLYDPNNPQAGIFNTWTERQWQETGSTGYGGYEVWRLIAPTPTP